MWLTGATDVFANAADAAEESPHPGPLPKGEGANAVQPFVTAVTRPRRENSRDSAVRRVDHRPCLESRIFELAERRGLWEVRQRPSRCRRSPFEQAIAGLLYSQTRRGALVAPMA